MTDQEEGRRRVGSRETGEGVGESFPRVVIQPRISYKQIMLPQPGAKNVYSFNVRITEVVSVLLLVLKNIQPQNLSK